MKLRDFNWGFAAGVLFCLFVWLGLILLLSGCQTTRYEHTWTDPNDIIVQKIKLTTTELLTFDVKDNLAVYLPDTARLGLDNTVTHLDPNALEALVKAGLLIIP